MLISASRFRLEECQNLKLEDLDRSKMLLNVVNGKGNKQRFTLLGKHALDTLTEYYYEYKPNYYLFENSDHQPLSKRTIEKIVSNAAGRAGITKRVTAHTLRHSFATHLLESNVSLVVIQKLLGHSSIRTTMVYLHVSNAVLSNVVNPLDICMNNTKRRNKQ